MNYLSCWKEKMMMKNKLIGLFLIWSCAMNAQDLSFDKTLWTIAIGSCNRQELPQHIWNSIGSHQPDLWIWMGDNIYGDTDDMSVMKAKYDQQKSGKEYSAFRKDTDIIGIWDDHDFGVNDGGREYDFREPSRDLMFDFLDVPKESPAWEREGGYQSYTYGEAGKKVKIILLDARYFREELNRVDGIYLKNWEGNILGDDQWAWLEDELSNSDADIHLISSGIQFIATEHRFEKWANFPRARQRMLDLLVKTQPKNAIFLSGDRHISETAALHVPGYGMIYDFTSSGMTHSYTASTEYNSYRIGKLVTEKSYGLIQIEWAAEGPKVSFTIRRDDDELIDGPIAVLN
jgi:alkaline phosphatase D